MAVARRLRRRRGGGRRGGRAESLVVEVEQRTDGDVDRGGEIERLRRPLRASPRVARGAAARGGARRRRRRRRRAGRRRGARLRGGARGARRGRRGTVGTGERVRERSRRGVQTLAAVLLGVAADVFVFARMSPRELEHAARAGRGHGVRLGAENLRLVRRVRLRGDARRASGGDRGRPVRSRRSRRRGRLRRGPRPGGDRDRTRGAETIPRMPHRLVPFISRAIAGRYVALQRRHRRRRARRRRRLVPLLHGFPASPPAPRLEYVLAVPVRARVVEWRARFNPPRPQRVRAEVGGRDGRVRLYDGDAAPAAPPRPRHRVIRARRNPRLESPRTRRRVASSVTPVRVRRVAIRRLIWVDAHQAPRTRAARGVEHGRRRRDAVVVVIGEPRRARLPSELFDEGPHGGARRGSERRGVRHFLEPLGAIGHLRLERLIDFVPGDEARAARRRRRRRHLHDEFALHLLRQRRERAVEALLLASLALAVVGRRVVDTVDITAIDANPVS